jgi:2-C-methyl-D-erythritol 4-phosphate cytidylyltransferase
MKDIRPSVVAIIPAAGASSRMGIAGSKALLELGGKIALVRVIEEIFATRLVSQFVVTAPAEQLSEFAAISFGSIPVKVINGGATRQQSVALGLECIRRDFPAVVAGFVLVHDAARCLVTTSLVRRAVLAAFDSKAVTTAVPVVDSIIRLEGEPKTAKAVDRSTLWCVQTPQVFEFLLLSRAHAEGPSGATDDASLVERIHRVEVVEGARENIKLTTPSDLLFAEALLKRSLFNA